jgi:hypothetical protein
MYSESAPLYASYDDTAISGFYDIIDTVITINS